MFEDYLYNRKSLTITHPLRYIEATVEAFLTTFVLYWLLHYREQNTLSSGALAGFLVLFQNFQTNMKECSKCYTYALRILPGIERFLDVMKAEPAIVSGPKSMFRKEVSGDIALENVSFYYPARPGQLVLDRLTLRFKPQKITAIVGDSGAGKSTIAKLLMRVYDPSEGTVRMDGVDLRDLDLENLHDLVSIVDQNPALFNRTLRMNIMYGAPNSKDTEKSKGAIQIGSAIEMANCDFVSSFRSGIDTAAGALGKQLSGGQKQRVAIARAAMRNPKILILDEATSALDAKNEQLVQEALEMMMQGRTIIIIAHRLSTIKNADDIVCLENGQVAEQGTHDELMQLKGHYHDLIKRQMFA